MDLTPWCKARAASGRPEFERMPEGTTWRFRNEGNRAAFAADPHGLLLRFGGYDPVALACGVAPLAMAGRHEHPGALNR
jgi:hypothetical protein